jgi:uncharacterized RDD family membrane protein YckC
MGIIILPILVILAFIGALIGAIISKALQTADTNKMEIKYILLWFLFFIPVNVLSFYILNKNFPSGSYGFGTHKEILLFCMAPILFGLSFSFSKIFALYSIKKFQIESKVIEQDDQTEQIKLENASILSRFWASIIDMLIIVAFTLPFIYLLDALEYIKFSREKSVLASITMPFVGIAVFFIINTKLLINSGQTIGKKINNIKIVRLDGTKPDFYQLLLKRYLPFFGFPYIPIIGGIVSFIDIWFIFGKQSQCLHDMIAGTKVVNSIPSEKD